MTVREALAEAGAAFRAAGIESSGLDASLLLAGILRRDRAALFAAGPDPLPEAALAALRRSVERRLAGECVAYILGRKEFRGLDFDVNPAVLVPRPETETLVETALEFAANAGSRRALDLCTGSGAVAIALKHEMPALEVWAVDISAGALETARANAARLLPGSPVNFLRGDLFGALHSAASFAFIAANPPYVPSAEIKNLSPEVQNEPLVALDGGAAGLDIIRNIIAGAPDFLDPGGALFLEADPGQMNDIAALLKERGFTGIKINRDLSGRERVIGGFKL
jgi:release factor glutamine methyltransferase